MNCVTGNKTIRNPNDRGRNELLRPTKYYGSNLTGHRHPNTPPNNKQKLYKKSIDAKMNCVTGMRNPNDRGRNELLRPTNFMGRKDMCHRHQNTPPNNKQKWTNV